MNEAGFAQRETNPVFLDVNCLSVVTWPMSEMQISNYAGGEELKGH